MAVQPPQTLVRPLVEVVLLALAAGHVERPRVGERHVAERAAKRFAEVGKRVKKWADFRKLWISSLKAADLCKAP